MYRGTLIGRQKNRDEFIIQELRKIFEDMDRATDVICPLEWVSAWVCYCSNDIEFPYSTYGIDYFLNHTFSTIKMVFDIEL